MLRSFFYHWLFYLLDRNAVTQSIVMLYYDIMDKSIWPIITFMFRALRPVSALGILSNWIYHNLFWRYVKALKGSI